ncbi:MAG: hypothetical protein JW770_07245 [Actinobacteria bacterium]|nr:hypothetical protein [Actinomycetota bacterium]
MAIKNMGNSNCRFKKRAGLLIMATCTAMLISLISGCTCPVFSLLERATGLDIRTGDNIEEQLMDDALVYPGSTVLVQVSGNMERIIEFIGDYGVRLSGNEKSALDQLPEDIKNEEINMTLYSTADNKSQVLDYYQSLTTEGWEMGGIERPGQDQGAGMDASILIASKNEYRQAFIVSGMENNTFIIFVDFNWETMGQLAK